jgi:integrase
MFLFKHKNGNYYVVYSLENGIRKTRSTGTTLKGEAHKFLSNLQRQIDEEKRQVVQPITINQFAFAYLRQREPYYTEKTIKTNKTTFRMLEGNFGNIQLSEITRNDLERYFHNRIKTSSIYSARKDLINISSAFNFAVDAGYLITNPCKGIKRFRLPERQPMFYSKEDFKKLIEVIDNQDLKDIVLFAINTGLRQMELITLDWRQINLKENILVLDNQSHITKSKRIVTIPLNTICVEILQRRIEKNEVNVFTLFDNPIDQGWLSRNFKNYVVKAGINPKLNFHSLRHSYASWLVQAGVSIYVVSKLLNHSDIKTTQIYAHLQRDDLRSAVNQLNGVI